MTPRTTFTLFAVCLISFAVSLQPAMAGPLNQWKISCGVDRGAIIHRGGVWTFSTSSNHCSSGVFNQRAEIKTRPIRASQNGAYMFQTYITLTATENEKFDLFQIHDGRDVCGPPLKVTVLESGRIELTTDVNTGPGESCKSGNLGTSASNGRIRRDGSEQKLEILINFDGTGAFSPREYFFKHGVYSRNVFDYQLISRDMRVSRVQVAG